MWAQLTPWIAKQARRLARGLAIAAVLLGRALAAIWRLLRPYVIFALNLLLALLLLFEEWGWRPLSNLLAQLARFRIWAAFELWLAGLPPYGALVALSVPSTIIIPAKLIGVYLLATGQILTATVVILCAKLAGTALIARVFVLTKPALMQINWFRYAYEAFVPWQEALFARIRNSRVWRHGRVAKWRANNYVRRSWTVQGPRLESAWADLKPKAIALGTRLQVRARHALVRTSDAGERLLRRLQDPD
jgi:hypothetical protein